MQFDLEQLQLIHRSLRYSINHLHCNADIANTEGRTHEAHASVAEAEKLQTVKDAVHQEIVNERIKQGRGTC